MVIVNVWLFVRTPPLGWLGVITIVFFVRVPPLDELEVYYYEVCASNFWE